MMKVECPSCEEYLKINQRLKVGQQIKCRYCFALLKVIGLDPTELDWEDEEYEVPDLKADRRPWRKDRRRRDFSLDSDQFEDSDDSAWNLNWSRAKY